MNPKVESFFENLNQWKEELSLLRKILLECQLTEEFKWRVPCYTFQNSNIALIHGFKQYCAIAFFKGALLKDSEGILIQQTENVQSGRQIRFANIQEILEKESIIKSYIYEAIEVEKAGLKVEYKKTSEFEFPVELENKLNADPELQKAFEALTPGRQRGYLLHFSSSKNPKTRDSRIDKCTARILVGKGLNDCICGRSKRMPNCDGSHKYI